MPRSEAEAGRRPAEAPGADPGTAQKISAVVMAHPRRAEAARALAERIALPDVRIVLDPDPQGPPRPSRTSRAACAAIAPDATHLVLVQDDAVIREDFAEHVRELAAHRPDDPVSLFATWCSRTSFAGRLALHAGATLTEICDGYTPSVALLLPRKLALAVAETEPDVRQADVAIGTVLVAHGARPLLAVPTAADHAEGPSLIGNDPKGRRHSVLYAPAVPGTDWTAEPYRPLTLPFYAWDRHWPLFMKRASASEPWRIVRPRVVLNARGLMAKGVSARASEEADRIGVRYGGRWRRVATAAWFTAALHGMAVADLAVGSGRPLTELLCRPGAMEATRTIGPAIFDRELGAEALERTGPEVQAVVDHGFVAGLDLAERHPGPDAASAP